MEQFCQNKKQLPAPHPGEIREQALALHRAKVPSSEIAESLNLPAATVRSWIRRQRKLSSAQQPDLDSGIEVQEAQEPIDIPDDLREQQEVYDRNLRRAAIVMSEAAAKMPAQEIIQKADKLLKADQIGRKALKLDTAMPNTVLQIGVLTQPLPSMVRPQKAVHAHAANA